MDDETKSNANLHQTTILVFNIKYSTPLVLDQKRKEAL